MSSSNTFRTLIVVDVQNCFINGGSLGYADIQDKDSNGTNIFNDLKKHAKITQRIDKLYAEGNYDLNVFTKDSHPMNHSSHFKDINPPKGLYFEHCVDCELARCKQRYVGYNFNKKRLSKITIEQRIEELEKKTKKDILSTIDKHNYFESVKDKPIKGIDFSYLFKFQPNLKSILENEKQYEVIKAKKECLGSQFDLEKQDDNFEIYKTSNKPGNILILRKGELCRYESYSAFNYHIYYENEPSKKSYLNPNENITKAITDLKQKYSTGLFENILEKAIMQGSKTVEIDVCGLVTNICVINTIRQGLAMWESIYSKKYNQITSVNFRLLDFASLPLQTLVFSNNNTVCDTRTPNKDIFLKNLEQLRDDNTQDLLSLHKESFTIVTKSSSRSSSSQSSNPLPERPSSAQLPKSSSSQSANPLPERPSSAQLPKSSSSQLSKSSSTRLTGTTGGKKQTKTTKKSTVK
jgi:nicotinamidase-related amidase